VAVTATAPAGGDCDGKPCWKETGAGFKYADGVTSPDGLFTLKLSSNAAGKGKITLKAKGPLLTLPALPLAKDPRVTVQLVGSEGQCWSADFTTADRNDEGQFKAKSD
jgi:hypothetical protein